MPEYSIAFAEKLIEAATVVKENGLDSLDARRTVLYLSLLSSEIALKAFLENAGLPTGSIKQHSHNLSTLLDAVCTCEVKDQTTSLDIWLPASRVCAIEIQIEGATSTVGSLLAMEQEGASHYPNEIRYGEKIVHVPAAAALQAAEKIHNWALGHIGKARRRIDHTGTNAPKSVNPRRRDTLAGAEAFCKAYGGGIKVGNYITKNDIGEYWIGFEVLNPYGEVRGEISAGYVGEINNSRFIGVIKIDDEVIEYISKPLHTLAQHDRTKGEQPKELKMLLIEMTQRAVKKENAKRGIQ